MASTLEALQVFPQASAEDVEASQQPPEQQEHQDRAEAAPSELLGAITRDDSSQEFAHSASAAGVSSYTIVGTKGSRRVEPAYSIAKDLVHHLTRNGKTRTRVFPAREQFAPELLYFSDCVLKDTEPEPSGEEGLADVRVLEGIERSVEEGRSVELDAFRRGKRPTPAQEMHRPLREKAKLVHVEDPTPSR